MLNTKLNSLVLILGAVILVFTGWFVKRRYIDRPTLITVVGEGRVKIDPSMVRFSVSISNQEENANKALADNRRVTKDLISIAKGAGVSESELIVSYPRVMPPSVALGQINYQAINAIDMTLKNLSVFDSLVNQLYNTGASSISNIVFTTENSKDLEKQAVTKAVEETESRAREIARSLHKGVGRIVSVSTVEIGEAGALTGELSQSKFTGETRNFPSQIEIIRQVSMVFELR